MRTIVETIKTNVYTFDELSDKAKENACQQIGDSMTSDDLWYEPVLEDFIEHAASYGLEVDEENIRFSGFWSQGDGASFTCNNIDVVKCLHALGIEIKEGNEKAVHDYIDASIERVDWHYCHENTVVAKVFPYSYEFEGENSDYIDSLAEMLEERLEDLKDDLCSDLYRDLEREYDFLHSEEYASEYKEILFLEDGTIYEWN